MLTADQVEGAALALHQAELTGKPIAPISVSYADATIIDAYAIATSVTKLKTASGRRIKGHKVGLTSKAMRDITGATEPDYGTLFDDWFVAEGSEIDFARRNRPLVEIELAFVLKRSLEGPGINVADVIRATDFVVAAIEIVDTRQTGRGSNGLVDSVSDSAACGLVVLGGKPLKLTEFDPRAIGGTLMINGKIEETGVARAVMANPLNAVAWLANKLSEFGISPEPGHVILSGSFIRAIPFASGDQIHAEFDRFGEVSFVAS